MSAIIPSILTAHRTDLVGKLKRLEGLAETVQVDVVDGVLASPATWPYAEGPEELATLSSGGGLQAFGHFRYEVDLMVREPEASLGAWIAAGASRLVVHIESTPFLGKLLQKLDEQYGHDKNFAPDLLSVGLALDANADASALEPYLERIDFVQFMGIAKDGAQGRPFEEKVVEKVRLFKRAHPDMPVQVDGGVSLESAPGLLAAGADRLMVGSALWSAPDLAARLKEFEALVERYGRYA